MQRVVGAVLVGVAGFLLVVAALARFYLPGQVVKFPLNEYSVTRLAGSHVSYFSESSVKEITGVNAEAVNTTQGDVSSGSSSTAVWSSVLGVFDTTNGNLTNNRKAITYDDSREAFDRRTGELVNCQSCGTEVDKKKVRFSGQGAVWPIGVKQQTYQVYDTTLLRAVPAVYAGTKTIDGFKTYEFIENINNQQFGTIKVPGSLVGMSPPSVTLPEYLTARIVTYVDPATGAPIKEVETQNQSLINPATGVTALVRFNGTLTSTPKSVASAISNARPLDNKITWVEDLAPLLALIIGALCLVIGLVMLAAGGGREDLEWEFSQQQAGAQAT